MWGLAPGVAPQPPRKAAPSVSKTISRTFGRGCCGLSAGAEKEIEPQTGSRSPVASGRVVVEKRNRCSVARGSTSRWSLQAASPTAAAPPKISVQRPSDPGRCSTPNRAPPVASARASSAVLNSRCRARPSTSTSKCAAPAPRSPLRVCVPSLSVTAAGTPKAAAAGSLPTRAITTSRAGGRGLQCSTANAARASAAQLAFAGRRRDTRDVTRRKVSAHLEARLVPRHSLGPQRRDFAAVSLRRSWGRFLRNRLPSEREPERTLRFAYSWGRFLRNRLPSEREPERTLRFAYS
jgi:hypothetical protein